MTSFLYSARDAAGAAVSGSLAAGSIEEVSRELRAQGKYPISIRPASAPGIAPSGGLKVGRADVIQFSQQLSIMLETGVTLSEALDCIAQQAHKPHVKALVEDLARHVQGGNDFSSALARHPRTFPRLYIALITASERSGMLSKLLIRATHYLKDEQDTLRRVRGALTYPAIMFGFACSVTIFLLTFVLPRFTVIYASKKAALPAPTQVLMFLSDAMINQWMWILGGLAVIGAAVYFYVSTPAGLRVFHILQLQVPLIGNLYRRLYLARGLRMVGTMAAAGVPLQDCTDTARELCANTIFRDLWTRVSAAIQTGKQFSEPMFDSPLVPRAIAQMLHSGEKGGKLAFVMEQVSAHAEAELKETIADLTRYIEPVMIAAMGLIIGGVALALLLPVFTISRVMSS